MSKQQHLLFDLDDTLIHCNKYFFQAVDQFVLLMLEWFHDEPVNAEDIRNKQAELDIALVKAEGFASAHFPASLVETYRYFTKLTGKKRLDEEENLLYAIGKSVYEQEFESYPDMQETLEQLQKEEHRLYLYTGGESDIQWRKIKKTGLERFFEDRIFISMHKTSEVMQNIVQDQKLDPTTTWMIGNSLRTDVVPALQTGLNTIHIPIENEWIFNLTEVNIEPKRAFYTVPHLRDVPFVIRDHFQSDKS